MKYGGDYFILRDKMAAGFIIRVLQCCSAAVLRLPCYKKPLQPHEGFPGRGGGQGYRDADTAVTREGGLEEPSDYAPSCRPAGPTLRPHHQHCSKSVPQFNISPTIASCRIKCGGP